MPTRSLPTARRRPVLVTLLALAAGVAAPACGTAEPSTTAIESGVDGSVATAPAPAVSSAPAALPPTRIAYGDDPHEFGDLYVPSSGTGPFPVVVLIHGGFWYNAYGLDLMVGLAEDLADRGYIAWNIEYRRIGDEGGGYTGTFDDVAAAIDVLVTLPAADRLDLTRLALVGHSAGGHLALWAAGRAALPPGTPGADPAVTPVLAIGQGPVVDLRAAAADGLGGGAVQQLLSGSPAQLPERYDVATPDLRGGPAVFGVVGSDDGIVPARYSIDPGQPDAIDLIEIEGADHFDLIDPQHPAWTAVVRQLETTLMSAAA